MLAKCQECALVREEIMVTLGVSVIGTVLEEAVHTIGESEEFLKRRFVSSINNLFKKSVLVKQSCL